MDQVPTGKQMGLMNQTSTGKQMGLMNQTSTGKTAGVDESSLLHKMDQGPAGKKGDAESGPCVKRDYLWPYLIRPGRFCHLLDRPPYR